MGKYISAELRSRLIEVDDHRCAYCKTTEMISGQAMTIDHIIPESQKGVTRFDNLCFCCRRCNEFKGTKTSASDPLTNEMVALFNPRRQDWKKHFTWDETGTIMVGLTNAGRATFISLNMNDPVIVATRRRWVSVGWHPSR